MGHQVTSPADVFFHDQRKSADAGMIATGSDEASTLLRQWHKTEFGRRACRRAVRQS